MAFPSNAAEMEQQGYIASGSSLCRGCTARVEWYVTPNGSKLCMDPMPDLDSKAVPHWATCPQAKTFKRQKKA